MNSRALLLSALLWSGCATEATPMVPVTTGSEQRQVEGSGVQVRLLKQPNLGLFVFEVLNLSQQPIRIVRDEVMLVTPENERQRREPGGADSEYLVAAGGVQRVNVLYRMTDRRAGELLRFDFSSALVTLHGDKLPLPMVATIY